MADFNKISLSQMQKLSEFESRLAKRDAKKLDANAVPTDTPLGVEIRRQQATMGDDLSGLPPGHPLIKILSEAKKRYEVEANAMAERLQKQNGKGAVKKSRNVAKVDIEAEELEASRVLAAHKVNRGIEKVDECLRELLKEIVDNEDLINREHVGRMRLLRLKRTADAMRRLLGESRIPGARA